MHQVLRAIPFIDHIRLIFGYGWFSQSFAWGWFGVRVAARVLVAGGAAVAVYRAQTAGLEAFTATVVDVTPVDARASRVRVRLREADEGEQVAHFEIDAADSDHYAAGTTHRVWHSRGLERWFGSADSPAGSRFVSTVPPTPPPLGPILLGGAGAALAMVAMIAGYRREVAPRVRVLLTGVPQPGQVVSVAVSMLGRRRAGRRRRQIVWETDDERRRGRSLPIRRKAAARFLEGQAITVYVDPHTDEGGEIDVLGVLPD